MRSRLGGQRTCQLRLQQYHLGAFRRKGGIELGETPRICRTRLPGYIGAWQRTTLPETAAHALDKSLQGLESIFFFAGVREMGDRKDGHAPPTNLSWQRISASMNSVLLIYSLLGLLVDPLFESGQFIIFQKFFRPILLPHICCGNVREMCMENRLLALTDVEGHRVRVSGVGPKAVHN